ncbi:acetyltransferase [Methanoplanus sp. FWC-SCC4]|uniref:Acetyltransferase n=1 Tax=Methanochimaera problematica TaxID=2609417 RepID=A0AA97FAN1_9EURY|nr:acetyltransferase [Methanoplanus sp. FWC-SCC4]WOF15895.1 acetyltransferase [Methanoplanus sp. FWC-SCC4]
MNENFQICPVVLVHGWRSHPGIWEKLEEKLLEKSIPCWNFSHVAMADKHPEMIAFSLMKYICDMREMHHYDGYIDIVSHSMGAGIARYMLEVIDGEDKSEKIRQMIGIGPPNNGSSMAELFCSGERGRRIMKRLEGVFVPKNFDPLNDPIVQEFRPGSKTVCRLKSGNLRDDIIYRVILTSNVSGNPKLLPDFNGKTWELYGLGKWRMTYFGDGIVPHSDSYLEGAETEILPFDSERLDMNPFDYSHMMLPKNPEVIDQIIKYVTVPEYSSK